MVQAVRANRTDVAGERKPDDTSPAMVGDKEYVCVDCDARQVEALQVCPSCGGVVVALHDMEEAQYDPLIGRKIGGRFTVVARLGAGSMGAVYRARQDGMSREVALKVLKPERAFDENSKARFEREARATSALVSPHTVTVYDFGEDETTAQGPLLYLAMERLEGESLGQRLKRTHRVPPFEAAKIVQQALRSLAEAHDKGVVHRDLKPDNIFLHRVPTPHGLEEIVKVLDFGIAKILQPDLKVDSLETQAGTVFGTPRYMSPEQAQSKPLDGRSDLYTIGLILFQMVTGRHVFPDEDAVVVMARHIQSLPPRPREVAPDAGISRKLEAVILRTLAKDPKRRPQSALELHEELEAAILDRTEPASEAVIPAAAPQGPSAMPSFGPTTDPSLEVSTAKVPKRAAARTAAIAVGFTIALVGAVGLGVYLAQNRSPSVVVQPASESKSKDKDRDEEKSEPKVKELAPQISTATATTTASAKSTETAKTAPAKTGKPASTKKDDVSAPPPPTATTTAPPPPATTTAPAATASTKKPPSYGKFD